MEEYGEPAAPPRPPKPAARVHRAGRAPAVSLLRPRPEAERERNAYVEAPRRGARSPPPLKLTPPPPAESIVCARCGRCRCLQCAAPRALPQRWLCGACLCSARAVVDYASCMCCAEALFYHCGGEAGCGRGARAAATAALALPLPCLLLYWPLRAAAALAAALYARARRPGCRCRADDHVL